MASSSKSLAGLSEHSVKFYDGTYRWDNDGFYDEEGVYRAWNLDDPAARPPTPRPPLSDIADDIDANSDGHIGALAAHAEGVPENTTEHVLSPDARAATETSDVPTPGYGYLMSDQKDGDDQASTKLGSRSPLSDYPSDLSNWSIPETKNKNIAERSPKGRQLTQNVLHGPLARRGLRTAEDTTDSAGGESTDESEEENAADTGGKTDKKGEKQVKRVAVKKAQHKKTAGKGSDKILQRLEADNMSTSEKSNGTSPLLVLQAQTQSKRL